MVFHSTFKPLLYITKIERGSYKILCAFVIRVFIGILFFDFVPHLPATVLIFIPLTGLQQKHLFSFLLFFPSFYSIPFFGPFFFFFTNQPMYSFFLLTKGGGWKHSFASLSSSSFLSFHAALRAKKHLLASPFCSMV